MSENTNHVEPVATSSESPAKAVWESPTCEELAVQLSAGLPGRGADGGRFIDCTRS
jgi:hypothetical protein